MVEMFLFQDQLKLKWIVDEDDSKIGLSNVKREKMMNNFEKFEIIQLERVNLFQQIFDSQFDLKSYHLFHMRQRIETDRTETERLRCTHSAVSGENSNNFEVDDQFSVLEAQRSD